jgi:Protein of unknown function (DUF4230)
VGRLARTRSGLGTAATVSLAVIALCLLGLVAFGLLSAFDIFGTEEIDRSGPAVLERIRKLERFEAGEANFSQDVDIEQDAPWLPDFIKGERVTAIVQGRVPATVDFGQLGPGSVSVDDDRTTIRLRLPEPTLGDPEIDEGNTDRIGDVFSGNPFDDSDLYRKAEDKLGAAAAKSDLLDQAKENTERWLRTFLGAAGFDTVEITWVKPGTP